MVARLGANVVCMRFAMEKKKSLEKVRFYLHKIDFEKTLLKTAGKIGKRSCWQAHAPQSQQREIRQQGGRCNRAAASLVSPPCLAYRGHEVARAEGEYGCDLQRWGENEGWLACSPLKRSNAQGVVGFVSLFLSSLPSPPGVVFGCARHGRGACSHQGAHGWSATCPCAFVVCMGCGAHKPAQTLVVHTTHTFNVAMPREKKLLVWTHGKCARSDATRRSEPCSRNAV
jgi:hypothetical protein